MVFMTDLTLVQMASTHLSLRPHGKARRWMLSLVKQTVDPTAHLCVLEVS